MPATKPTNSRRAVHGNLLREFRRTDPRGADVVAARGASAFRRAAHSLKVAECTLGVSDSTASEWQRTGHGSPVTAFLSLILRLARDPRACPGALVVEAKATLIECVMPLTDADLVARFRRLMGDEAEAEGRENHAQATFWCTGDLATLESTTQREADIQTELVVVIRELRRRSIDPRTWGMA